MRRYLLPTLVILNNAPALSSIKEKLSLKNLYIAIYKKLHKSKESASDIKDDAAEWKRIPTKIDMDVLLTVDLKTDNRKADPRKKEGK